MVHPHDEGDTARRPGHAAMARPLAVLALLLLPVAAAGGEVTVAVDPAPHACAVRGRFHVDLPPSAAWRVVTDYDHIPDFVHSMLSSRSERRPDGRRVVEQTARGGFFLFKRRVHVVLEVDEDPQRRIGFRDVLGKDFERYDGEWRLEPDSTGTSVRYSLDAEPRSSIPRSVCRHVLKGSATELMTQVRDEMLRRAAMQR